MSAAPSDLRNDPWRLIRFKVPFTFAESADRFSAYTRGLTDHPINDLSRVSGLFVIAAETSHSIRQPDTPAEEQASRRGIGYAVTATMLRAVDGARVRVKLVEAGTGTSLRAKDYDQRGSGVLGIHDDMAREIAAVPGVELSEQVRRTIDHIPTHDA